MLTPGGVAGVFFSVDLICWHHAIEDVGAGLATVLRAALPTLRHVAATWLYRGGDAARLARRP